ncbi:precorrin-3B synthase [Pseudomonas sp.]|uniref:precorrin-3B synthase n=1 Tax=Pseudomonas sp. TaxID=306 RepID=UPI003FD7F0B0
MNEPMPARTTSISLRPSACPGLLRIVPALDGGICRIKLAGGSITVAQACAVADAAQRYAGGVIEATNRANLQIRGVGADQDGLIAILLDAGLGPTTAASDDVRNLMLSPTAGIDPQQLFDSRPLAAQILGTLENAPRFHDLSPKFALSLDGGEALAMLEHPHDMWLSARMIDDDVLMAFGLAGCPAEDAPLAAVPLSHAHELVVAVLDAFLELARPEQTRMRHLLAEMSTEAFLQAVAKRMTVDFCRSQRVGEWLDTVCLTHRLASKLAPTGGQLQSPANRHLGIYSQDVAGLVAVGGAAPLGRLGSSMLRAVAQLAAEWGDGTLRLTPWQSLLLPNVRRDHAANVLTGLQAAGLICSPEQPLAHLIACTGSAGCGKGLADTKADALLLAARLEHLDLKQAAHLTGCSRSCAAAHVAPVTLLAVSAGHYDLYFRDAQQPGFGSLRARDLTIEAVGTLLAADSRSSTDD